MLAASGSPPRADHAFRIEELPQIFEQLMVQLQDFPAPPLHYRPQTEEPALTTDARVRVITGFSGAGKTMWVAQAAQHSNSSLAYFDVGDTPGSTIAISLARELAGRFFGKCGGLGTILLPGATGTEMLRGIALRLQSQNVDATVVIDNAHRVSADSLRAMIQQTPHLRFVLLGQPGAVIQELQTTLALTWEPLRGWTTDTIAAEAADAGCLADFAACQRLLKLTAGLPLYVQNAVQIAVAECGSELARFCDELEARTHSVTTAQEIILARVFNSLTPRSRDAVSILGMSDIPLTNAEAATLLKNSLGFDDRTVATVVRELRPVGVMEIFGGERLKIRDAMRLLGRAHLDTLGTDLLCAARLALKDVLLVSILQQRDIAKLSLYLRVLGEIGDIKSLVQFATDELFHEMGVIGEISDILEKASMSDAVDPMQRFLALDGLAFGDLKDGDGTKAAERLDMMSRLVADYKLSDEERLTLVMKKMNLAALQKDPDQVLVEVAQISTLLPDNLVHRRVFKYNAAHALYDLRRYEACVSETHELIMEYYDVLGLELGDVMMKNPDKIFPLLKKGSDRTDDLKHLADCLNLQANAVNKLGQDSPFARIHAMKFYAMANALDSVVRVGQDLVDERVKRNDYIGARDVIERNLLPTVVDHKMVARIVPVRSQYAVVLAYCGDHVAAAAEMASLAPYEAGLDAEGQGELRNQRSLVAQLRTKAPPPQWIFPAPSRKMGRNEPCYCGSGKKFKRCHGKMS